MIHQIFENFKHLHVEGPLRECPRAWRSTRSTPECIQIFFLKNKIDPQQTFFYRKPSKDFFQEKHIQRRPKNTGNLKSTRITRISLSDMILN